MAFQYIKAKLKEKLHALASLIPFGIDLLLLLSSKRGGLSYRGRFSSYDDANKAAKSINGEEYDVINKNKANNEDNENKVLDNWLKDFDYPLFFWSSNLLPLTKSVFELGGSLGHFYYSLKNLGLLHNNLKWTIAELPEAVALGQKIAIKRNEQQLSFIGSDSINPSQSCDLFITAGTIQYIEQDIWDILDAMHHLPEHVLIHQLPTHEKLQQFTLQNLGVCEVPYRIYAFQQLKNELKERGYSLCQSWSFPRSLTIPFHRSYKIDSYSGFYFRRAA